MVKDRRHYIEADLRTDNEGREPWVLAFLFQLECRLAKQADFERFLQQIEG